MFCVKCRAQLDDNAIFCPKCGNKVGEVSATASASPEVIVKSIPICYRYFPREFSFSLKLLLYQKCGGGYYLRKQIILAYYIYYINLYYYT